MGISNTALFIALSVFMLFVSLFVPVLIPTEVIVVDNLGNPLPEDAYIFKYNPDVSLLGGPVWIDGADAPGYIVQSFKFMFKISTYQIKGVEVFSVFWTFLQLMWLWLLANLVRGTSS